MAKRYVSLDIARGLALFGIMYAHLGNRDTTGLYYFGNGVAPALFAILAGISLSNFHKNDATMRYMNIARGVFFIFLGLAMGLINNTIFIILVNFGFLFIIGSLFIGLSRRLLIASALSIFTIMPIVSFLLQKLIAYNLPENASFVTLASPGEFMLDLFLTGPYPLILWLGYFLLGMAFDVKLLKTKASYGLLMLSAGGAIVMLSISLAALSLSSVQQALAQAYPGASWSSGYEHLQGGLLGTVPEDARWQWLLVYFPHSGTPFDLFITTGFALALIIIIDKIYTALASRQPLESFAEGLRVFFGLGTMSLSLYSLHVLMNTKYLPPSEGPVSQIDVHFVTLALIGALFALNGWRGPLEHLERASSKAIVRMVRKSNLSS